MEPTPECAEVCCVANENAKEDQLPFEAGSEREKLHSSESKYVCESDTCTSAAAFPVSHSDKELGQSHLLHSIRPAVKFVAAVDNSVYDSSRSVACSLSDVDSDSTHSRVEDDFGHGGTVPKFEEKPAFTIDSSTLDQQFSHDSQQQGLLSNTTFLSCGKEMSAKASCLSVLANRVKFLCNLVTDRTRRVEYEILSMALYGTSLTMVYRRHSTGRAGICQCDLFVADICISSGQSKTKKTAKKHAHSDALELLQKSYLHVEESSLSDSTMRLVGLEKPSVKESYDIVTQLDVPSCDVFLSASDVNDSGEQQTSASNLNLLVVRLKHLIGAVRTIFHVLETTDLKSGMCKKLSIWPRKLLDYQQKCGLSADSVFAAACL